MKTDNKVPIKLWFTKGEWQTLLRKLEGQTMVAEEYLQTQKIAGLMKRKIDKYLTK